MADLSNIGGFNDGKTVFIQGWYVALPCKAFTSGYCEFHLYVIKIFGQNVSHCTQGNASYD